MCTHVFVNLVVAFAVVNNGTVSTEPNQVTFFVELKVSGHKLLDAVRLGLCGHAATANPDGETNDQFASLICDWLDRRSGLVLYAMPVNQPGWDRNQFTKDSQGGGEGTIESSPN